MGGVSRLRRRHETRCTLPGGGPARARRALSCCGAIAGSFSPGSSTASPRASGVVQRGTVSAALGLFAGSRSPPSLVVATQVVEPLLVCPAPDSDPACSQRLPRRGRASTRGRMRRGDHSPGGGRLPRGGGAELITRSRRFESSLPTTPRGDRQHRWHRIHLVRSCRHAPERNPSDYRAPTARPMGIVSGARRPRETSGRQR